MNWTDEMREENTERAAKLVTMTARRMAFDRRAIAMQTWEDLTGNGIPADLEAKQISDRKGQVPENLSYRITISTSGIDAAVVSGHASARGGIVRTGFAGLVIE